MSIGNILLAAASIVLMVSLGIMVITFMVAVTWMQVKEESGHACNGREPGGDAR